MKINVPISNITIEKTVRSDVIGEDVIEATESVIKEMKRQFPMAMRKFRGIVFKAITQANFDSFDNQIRYPIYGLNTLDIANKSADQETSAVIGEFVGALWHEFGHFIDNYIKLKNKENPEIQDQWFERKKELMEEIGHVSEYSKTRLGEWFAERFDAEQLNMVPKRLIQLIHEFL